MPQHWGEWAKKGCKDGKREHWATLWDIPWLVNWNDACKNQDGVPGGGKPDYCEEHGGRIYGVKWVPDSECNPKWGDFVDKGCAENKRKFSAKLDGSHRGDKFGGSWERGCEGTELPNHLKGLEKRCVKETNGIWAEVFKADSKCSSSWGTWSNCCHEPGLRKYWSQLQVKGDGDWMLTCNRAIKDAKAHGKESPSAKKCVERGFEGVFGELYYKDDSCKKATACAPWDEVADVVEDAADIAGEAVDAAANLAGLAGDATEDLANLGDDTDDTGTPTQQQVDPEQVRRVAIIIGVVLLLVMLLKKK